METFQPNLDQLRQALGMQIQEIRGKLIKTTFPWSLIYRVTLYPQGHSNLESVIVKAIDPKGPSDRRVAEREMHFYRSVYHQLTLPKPAVYFLGVDEMSGWNIIIMEDLSSGYRIPQPAYQWTRKELQAVLKAYGILHGSPLLPPTSDRGWLNPRHESQLDFDLIPELVAIVQQAGIWGELPELPDLINYARASCREYANIDISLLHNDTTPTNAALPKKLDSHPAMLFDWQDAGIGMPEMDLAYLDLQPFHSAHLITRRELLSIYWQMRAERGDELPTEEERVKRQLHADLIMALWLTRPASRVALHPYPEGSYPRRHWDSHFGIVYNRLQALALEINP